jgi:hypothetical protein
MSNIFLPLVLKIPSPPPPAPVLNPISNPDGDGSYTVEWQNVGLAESYILEEATNANFIPASIVYQGTGTSFATSNQPEGTYYYRVKATNNAGDSDWSNTQSVTVQSLTCTPDPPGESDNINDALTVCSGQTVTGQVSDEDWDDVYKILAEENQQLTISMSGTGGDADLYLYAPGTTDIYTDPYSDISNNADNNEYIHGTILIGGYWYIDIYSYEGTTNYNVTITLSGPGSSSTKTIVFNRSNQTQYRRLFMQ